MERSIEWITFDCYGTLIDWEGGVANALGSLLPPPVDRAALAARYIAVEAEVEHERYRPYRDVLAVAGARVMEALGGRRADVLVLELHAGEVQLLGAEAQPLLEPKTPRRQQVGV